MLGGDFISIVILVVCLFLSAFFSSSETALFSLQGSAKLKHLVSINAPGAALVKKMLDDPGRLLSTILLGNNLVNITFAAIMSVISTEAFGPATGIIVATLGGTTVILVFGEIIPKTFAARSPETVAFLFAPIVKGIEYILYPLVAFFQMISRIANVGRKRGVLEASITEAELRTLITLGEAEGQFKPEEAEMLESVFRFGDRQVRDIMTPRTEITFVEQGATLARFLEVYARSQHTRYPVFQNDTDDVVGIISAKDVLRTIAGRPLGFDRPIKSIIREAYFIPETKRIAELFEEMRTHGHQVALAVDEFGGVSGLVTLKRLLEEVVGDVGEEGEAPEPEYEEIDRYTFQVDGGMSIDDASELLGINLTAGEVEYETVAGFVLDELGHIPAQGEQLEYGNYRIEVTRMNDLRIESVKFTKKPPAQVAEQVE
ncbi:MAG: HlyC/CorC family transporter [SAR202 cluster bacterium]|nr:HlyC/CorC family transporter [SAR202 cluster bacterium]